ncbi:hypothetical protein GALL_459110 [mine drainage metagenome]|uniref:Uncharacterized protein n=1 Tax=mine drainage metagenome TaxID=410659 RepID=A0A1J5PLQ2_9ZZZZ
MVALTEKLPQLAVTCPAASTPIWNVPVAPAVVEPRLFKLVVPITTPFHLISMLLPPPGDAHW